MRIVAVAVLLASSLVGLAACSVDAEEESANDSSNLDGVTCTSDVMLHIRADTYMPDPHDYKGKVRFNGCWRFERPVQADWGKCDTRELIVKKPQTDRWFYDEIWQPKHVGSDLSAIKKCHAAFGLGKGEAYAVWTGAGGFGDVGCPNGICLPDGSGKRVDISTFIDRVWVEAYTDAAMSYFKAHRSVGRPMIDITAVADPYAQVKKLCDDEGREGIAVYVGPQASGEFTPESFRMGRLIQAMNDCSGKGTPKTTPPPKTTATTTPPPAPKPTSTTPPPPTPKPTSTTPPPPPPSTTPAPGVACPAVGAKTCMDGDIFIECESSLHWSKQYSCGTSYPGTTCRSGYCVGPN